MKLSFVLCAFERPAMPLICSLASIHAQTYRDIELIMVDNSRTEHHREVNRGIFESLDSGIAKRYVNTNGPTCYHSTEEGVNLAAGDYVCFPSDDGYYVPRFAETMLDAAERNHWDLTYCNMVHWGFEVPRVRKYYAMNVEPKKDHIDKTSFILRRSAFIPFPGKPHTDIPASCDGALIEELMRRGVSHGKVEDVLLVHN